MYHTFNIANTPQTGRPLESTRRWRTLSYPGERVAAQCAVAGARSALPARRAFRGIGMPGGTKLPRTRYILGELVGHVTSIAQIKTVKQDQTQEMKSAVVGAATLTRRLATASACARAQAIVRVPRWHRDTKLDYDSRRNSKMWAHDEYDMCSVGDLVRCPTPPANHPPCDAARPLSHLGPQFALHAMLARANPLLLVESPPRAGSHRALPRTEQTQGARHRGNNPQGGWLGSSNALPQVVRPRTGSAWRQRWCWALCIS